VFSEVKVLMCFPDYFLDISTVRRLPNLRFILSPTTGVTHLDRKLLSRSDIQIIKLDSSSPDIQKIRSTVELGIWHCIESVRQTSSHLVFESSLYARPRFPCDTLQGKNILIVGFGRIGRQMASILTALGGVVSGVDPRGREPGSTIPVFENLECKKLSQLLTTIELVVIACSYEGYAVFSKDVLNRLPKGCSLVNIARGDLVDEKALVQLLEQGVLERYCTDVATNSLLKMGDRFLALTKLGKLVVTPHIGGFTEYGLKVASKFVGAKYIEKSSSN